LPTDRDTGKLRGFAFVTYRDSRDAHDACGAMHGRDYHGRQITVNIAKPRGPRDEGKGGGGGGGGGSYQGGKGGSYSYSRPRDYDRGFDERRQYEERNSYDTAGPRERERDDGYGPGRDRDRDRDRDGGYGQDRDRDRDNDDRFAPRYTHGNSYDGSGRYGEKDPRAPCDYYD